MLQEAKANREGNTFTISPLHVGGGFLCLEVVIVDPGPLPDNLLKNAYIIFGAIIVPPMFVAS